MCPQKIPFYSSSYKTIKTQDFGKIQFNNAFDAPPFKSSYNFDEDTFNEKNGRFIEPGALSVLIKKINNPKYELTEAEKKYFVTGFDMYSLKKGLNTFSEVKEQMPKFFSS